MSGRDDLSAPSLRAARALAEAALDRKALDVVALDVRPLTSFAEAFVIATGTSDRHVRSIADAVLEKAEEIDQPKLGAEGYDDGRWVLLDFNDVVVHIFQRETREEYDLERLWSDATVIELDQDLGERGAL